MKMGQLLTRQPAFLLTKNNYREYLLTGIQNSFCYELIISEKLVLIPNGCLEIIWNMNKKELYCLGYLDTYRVLDLEGDKLFGIHINYHYQCSYDVNRVISWLMEIAEQHSFAERAGLCDRQFNEILYIEEVHPLVRYGLNQIEEAKGKVAVETIATEFGYTSRHMERLFLQTFSYGPKRFCQYMRLLNVIADMIKHPDKNLSSLIENIGYSDQSHFQREFKMFTGMTPRQFAVQYLKNG